MAYMIELMEHEDSELYHVILSGGISLDEGIECMKECNELSLETGITDILVDFRMVESMPFFSEIYYLGTAIADNIRAKFRVAALFDNETKLKFLENVTHNRGGQMIYFTDISKAIKWLLR